MLGGQETSTPETQRYTELMQDLNFGPFPYRYQGHLKS